MTADFPTLSDEELARHCQAGSLVAFEELVSRFENRIYAFVYQSCRHDADAREITQDTFVRAFQALAQFDPNQSFSSWLFTIARHKCIDRFRARKPVTDAEAPEAADERDPAALLAEREEAQSLWSVARRALPDSQYQALWLRYVEDMNVAQIAAALGRTQTHIKVMLLRARRALSSKLPSPKPRPASAPARAALPVSARGGPL